MRLSTKLLLISELVLLLLVFGMILPIRVQMRSQAIADIQHELQSVAATAALQLPGDLHAEVAQTQDHESEAFHELREKLLAVAMANNYSPDNIYTFFLDDQTGVLRYGVMLQEDTFVGHEEQILEHHAMASSTGDPYASELFEDAHGEWIVGVAPIRDSQGKIVGLLEVNQPATAYFDRVDRAIVITTFASLGGLIVASILGYFVLRALVIRPVQAIHDGMIALGNQDFAHKTVVKTGDEFEQLAESLNTMAEQLNVARKIQEGFVPQEPPRAPGYRFAYRSDPCDATGGDYIDAFDLPDGHVAVLVADVTGHGIGPSLIMASCRSALRALAETGLPPGPLLDKLEQQIVDDLTMGRFITMIYGVLAPDGRFTYANAGHAPAMIVNDGKIVRLESHRPPLGIVLDYGDNKPALDDTQTTLQLHDGDRVVFTSDGVNESQDNRNEQFGLDRIEATAKRRDLDAIAFVELLNDQVTLHRAGQPAIDDITMLCIDRVPQTAG
ncbi:MAG: SpoIIE family protein phosphatase [Planctomycetota bacterium]